MKEHTDDCQLSPNFDGLNLSWMVAHSVLNFPHITLFQPILPCCLIACSIDVPNLGSSSVSPVIHALIQNMIAFCVAGSVSNRRNSDRNSVVKSFCCVAFLVQQNRTLLFRFRI
jgi:hypothetical protein